MRFPAKLLIGVVGTAAALANVASGDVVIATMQYDDLRGDYVGNSSGGVFTATAVNQVGGKRSYGDVSRLVTPASTARFQPGFVGAGGFANFVVTINVGAVSGLNAPGVGTLVATDIDGDTITATLDGNWGSPAAGFVFFSGAMTNVFFNDNFAQDGQFNGSLDGSIDMNLPGVPPFEGWLVQLLFGAPGFFNQNFSDRAVGLNAQIIPAPGAIALLGLGGLAAVSRRRR